jgi:hypothetical protein
MTRSTRGRRTGAGARRGTGAATWASAWPELNPEVEPRQASGCEAGLWRHGRRRGGAQPAATGASLAEQVFLQRRGSGQSPGEVAKVRGEADTRQPEEDAPEAAMVMIRALPNARAATQAVGNPLAARAKDLYRPLTAAEKRATTIGVTRVK